MSSSHFALSALRGSRNGYSWLNSDERKGKSSRAFISPSISKKIFAKQSRASPVTKSRKLVRLCRRKKKIKFSKTNIFYQDGRRISKKRGLVMKFCALDEKKRKNRNLSSFFHSFSSISSSISLLQCNFPSIRPGRISLSFLVSRTRPVSRFPVTCRHSADLSKIYPSTNVPFRFSICPVQRTRILLRRNTDDENRASPRRNSLSFFLSFSLKKNDLSTIEFQLNSF